MSRLGCVSVFLWNKEDFSSSLRVEPKFVAMTIDEGHFVLTRSRHGLQRHLLILSVEALPGSH